MDIRTAIGSFHHYSDDGEAVGRVIRAQHDIEFDVYPVKIGPGEFHVTRRRQDLIITVLGSCVAACIRDPVAGIGGMNHFMLPDSECGIWEGGAPSLRFGTVAMGRLVSSIIELGGVRERLEAKLIGGANVMDFDSDVGERNCEFAIQYIRQHGIRLAASDLGGSLARRVHFLPVDGRMWLKSLPADVLERERTDVEVWAGSD